MSDRSGRGEQTCCRAAAAAVSRTAHETSRLYARTAALYAPPTWDLVGGAMEQLILDYPECLLDGGCEGGLADTLDRLKKDVYRFGLDVFEAEYVRLFVNAPEGVAAPPYASFYGQGRLLGRAAEDAGAFYARFGLTLGEDNRDGPDHIVTELEFLSLLGAGEADTLRDGMAEDADALRAARAEFLSNHVFDWANRFCERLISAGRLVHYRILGAFTKGLLRVEKDGLG